MLARKRSPTDQSAPTPETAKHPRHVMRWAWMPAACHPVDEGAMEPAAGPQDSKHRQEDELCTTGEDGADTCRERCGTEAATATPSALPRTSSYTFRRAFFRAYVEKHCANPSHLGTIIEGSCPFVQSTHAL